jgi:hypothetical protein
MCVKNIAPTTYYDGEMLVITTTNLDKMNKMRGTAREMTEAQRDSNRAPTENLVAVQKRGVGLAQGGMEFLRLQEQNTKAAQQWIAASMKVAQLQQLSVRFAQEWMHNGAEALREQTEHNLHTAQSFARSARKQQEGFRIIAEGWSDAYEGFVISPFDYAQEGIRMFQRAAEQGVNVTQRVVEQGTEATEQVTRQGLRIAEEVTREAELRASVIGALGLDDYDGLNFAEVTEKLDELSLEEHERLRELEKRAEDRESLLRHIDRKIRTNSQGKTLP